jgi:hypothetical protein
VWTNDARLVIGSDMVGVVCGFLAALTAIGGIIW